MTFDYKGYWDARYRAGQGSGDGSRGKIAVWKARIIGELVADHDVRSIIDFGCGDGYQLALVRAMLDEPTEVMGLDVSPAAVEACRTMFAFDEENMHFQVYDPSTTAGRSILVLGDHMCWDMAMSLDMLMHITDDDDFEATLADHFRTASKVVAICTALYSGYDYDPSPHMAHRDVLGAVSEVDGWEIADVVRYPGITHEDRKAGVIGECISDFVVLTRKG